MVKKKRQRKKKSNSFNLVKTIALAIITIVALSILTSIAYIWFSKSGIVDISRAKEVVILSFSESGIAVPSIEKSEDEYGNLVYKVSVSKSQLEKFEKNIKNYINEKSSLKIKKFKNGKVCYIDTTTSIVKVVLANKKKYLTKKKKSLPKKIKIKKPKINLKKLTKKDFPQPLLAIIIDDVGIGNMDSFKKALTIPYPLTFAILPFRSFSNESAELAKGRGYEMILHMPMEPYGYPKKDPGPGAIFEKDKKKLIEEKLESAFNSVKYAKGLNNHMGSKITALKYSTRVFLNYLKENGYFFIDSRTSVDTVALIEARKMKIKSLKRDVFLDNSRKRKQIELQLKKAVTLAKENGYAVAIGHNYPETIYELYKLMPELDKEINFVFVKDLADELSK